MKSDMVTIQVPAGIVKGVWDILHDATYEGGWYQDVEAAAELQMVMDQLEAATKPAAEPVPADPWLDPANYQVADPAAIEAYLDGVFKVFCDAGHEIAAEPDDRLFIVARAGAELFKRNANLGMSGKDPEVSRAVKKAAGWFTALARGSAIER